MARRKRLNIFNEKSLLGIIRQMNLEDFTYGDCITKYNAAFESKIRNKIHVRYEIKRILEDNNIILINDVNYRPVERREMEDMNF